MQKEHIETVRKLCPVTRMIEEISILWVIHPDDSMWFPLDPYCRRDTGNGLCEKCIADLTSSLYQNRANHRSPDQKLRDSLLPPVE